MVLQNLSNKVFFILKPPSIIFTLNTFITLLKVLITWNQQIPLNVFLKEKMEGDTVKWCLTAMVILTRKYE